MGTLGCCCVIKFRATGSPGMFELCKLSTLSGCYTTITPMYTHSFGNHTELGHFQICPATFNLPGASAIAGVGIALIPRLQWSNCFLLTETMDGRLWGGGPQDDGLPARDVECPVVGWEIGGMMLQGVAICSSVTLEWLVLASASHYFAALPLHVPSPPQFPMWNLVSCPDPTLSRGEGSEW